MEYDHRHWQNQIFVLHDLPSWHLPDWYIKQGHCLHENTPLKTAAFHPKRKCYLCKWHDWYWKNVFPVFTFPHFKKRTWFYWNFHDQISFEALDLFFNLFAILPYMPPRGGWRKRVRNRFWDRLQMRRLFLWFQRQNMLQFSTAWTWMYVELLRHCVLPNGPAIHSFIGKRWDINSEKYTPFDFLFIFKLYIIKQYKFSLITQTVLNCTVFFYFFIKKHNFCL